jgi:hypothetical protein
MDTKRTFTQFFEPLIQIVQMIFRWIDIEISQLFHVLSFFSNSEQFLNNLENTEIRMY